MTSDFEAGHGRRQESLAARQARVGILANPRSVALPRPAPREVWTRWPELRAAKRRARATVMTTGQQSDGAALDDFVRSVRRAGPVPDPDCAEPSDQAPEPSWIGRLMAGLAVGVSLLVAMFYFWRAVWLAV